MINNFKKLNTKKIIVVVAFIFLTIIGNKKLIYADYMSDKIIINSGENEVYEREIENKYVSRFGDAYCYYDAWSNLITSKSPGRLERINDTFYFVDENGFIFMKYVGDGKTNYMLVSDIIDNNLSQLIGQELTSDNVFAVNIGNNLAGIKSNIVYDRISSYGAPEHSIYVSRNDDPATKGIYLIGDSYAYLLEYNCSETFKYTIATGYAVADIKNELLDYVDLTGEKFCFVFIGPNDLMRQTPLYDFEKDLEYIINFIKVQNVTPVFANYMGVSHVNFNTDYYSYDSVIRKLCALNDCIYIDLSDIDYDNVRETDYVHPASGFYKPAVERVLEWIKNYQ